VKWTKRSRQALGVLKAHGRTGTLMLTQLAWAEDFRSPPAPALAIQQSTVSTDEIEAARALISAMGDTTAAIDELRDDAIAMREELLKRALAGEMDTAPVIGEAKAEVDLMGQLASSLEQVRS
jgi:non-homologous end joining protein Ku